MARGPAVILAAYTAVVFAMPGQAAAGRGISVLASPTCSSATLTSDKVSPQPGGAVVTFTATAPGTGCSGPTYEFWMWTAAAGWMMRQVYGTNSHFILDTTGMAPGTYTVDAWVEQSGSPVGKSNYETFGLEAWVVGGCDSAFTMPTVLGTTGNQIVTAYANGVGCNTPLFQFWTYSTATGWVLEQPYSTKNSWTVHVDALAPGTYSVDVWVKQQGSPLQYETWALATIPKDACGNNAATAIYPTANSPRPVGETIHFYAGFNPSNNPCALISSFKYWAYPGTAGGWQQLSGWSQDGHYDWVTAGMKPGTQSIVVHVVKGRPVTADQAPDTWGLLSYSLFGCSSVTLTAAQPSPQPAGTTVQVYGFSSGLCNPLYQFWYYPPGGPWTMAQDFNSNSSFFWNTTGRAVGTYAWVVYVKQMGAGNAFDTYALLNYTLG